MGTKSAEENAFMEKGGYGVLMQFDRGTPFRRNTLESQFGVDLVDEAIQLRLVEVRLNPLDMSEVYLFITQRGIEVRDN